jgi:3-methyladenine DNA glycosylase AlkD
MELQECITLLNEKADSSTRKVYLNGGAKEPVLGVKMGELRKIAKSIEIDFDLAQSLYASGIHDAMLLGGMICDPKQMTRDSLDLWSSQASCTMIAERCVAPLAVVRNDAWEIADAWTKQPEEMIACAGYSIYGMLFSHIPDQDLDLPKVRNILNEIESRIKIEKPYLQYAMNNCLIMAGMYIQPLTEYCIQMATRIGYIKPTRKVNNCNIQSALDYINRYAPRTKVKTF